MVVLFTERDRSLPAICINSMLTKFHCLCIMGLKGALLFCTKIHTDGDYKMTQNAWTFSARCSSKKSFKKSSNCGRCYINKKSRIYGTSDRSDLSIYLSHGSRFRSGCRCGFSLTLANLIGSDRSHDKWERMWERMWERILGSGFSLTLANLIGSDRSHDLESAPASAPFSLLSDWIGRSVTANGRRERIGSGCGSGFWRKLLIFDSNSTSDRFYQMC